MELIRNWQSCLAQKNKSLKNKVGSKAKHNRLLRGSLFPLIIYILFLPCLDRPLIALWNLNASFSQIDSWWHAVTAGPPAGLLQQLVHFKTKMDVSLGDVASERKTGGKWEQHGSFMLSTQKQKIHQSVKSTSLKPTFVLEWRISQKGLFSFFFKVYLYMYRVCFSSRVPQVSVKSFVNASLAKTNVKKPL